MAGDSGHHDISGATSIAAWSAITGLLTSFMLVALSGVLFLNERESTATTLGALGFLVSFVAPFAVPLASLLAHRPETRRSAWLAAGVLALYLAALTIFSGVGLLYGMAGVGFTSALWLATGSARVRGSARSLVLAGWLLIWLGSGLLLLRLHATPACWITSQAGSGWRLQASHPTVECVSDITDDKEGLLALSSVVIGIVGAVPIARGGRGNNHGTGLDSLCSPYPNERIDGLSR